MKNKFIILFCCVFLSNCDGLPDDVQEALSDCQTYAKQTCAQKKELSTMLKNLSCSRFGVAIYDATKERIKNENKTTRSEIMSVCNSEAEFYLYSYLRHQ